MKIAPSVTRRIATWAYDSLPSAPLSMPRPMLMKVGSSIPRALGLWSDVLSMIVAKARM